MREEAMSPNFLSREDGNIDHEIIDLMFALMDAFKGYFVAALESVDLAISHGHLLMCLDEPTPMHMLAKRMGFDASHITAIIDRLEERQLIERHADPHDRRVKRIVLTEAGLAVKEQIRDHLTQTAKPVSNLTDQQRVELRDLLAVAVGSPEVASAR
jgi:DNA-binding MarR family transcriptional regulator